MASGSRSEALADAGRLFSCLLRGRDYSPPVPPAPDRHSYQRSSSSSSASSSSSSSSSASISSAPQNAGQKQPHRMEITPGIFYGSPLGKRSKQPPQLLRLLNEIRGDLKEDTNRSIIGEAVWSTFARQEQAIQYADSHHKRGLAIFTYQDHVTGQRRFLATTYHEFWNRYHKMQRELRHHYEIIREKAPCHLYFDVEYNRLANEGADGEVMVDLLLEIVSVAFHDAFSLLFDYSWVLELDSSTREKFSRHLIIRTPKAAFKDNSHAGAFVAEVCARIERLREDDKRLEQLYIMDGDSRETLRSKLFVDQGVYTRNRSFRLVFSAKAGKTAVLLPTYRFSSDVMDDHTTFMQSLICKVDADCETLLTFGEEGGGHGRRQCFKQSPAFTPQSSVGASPFAAVDSFIESVSCVGDVPGKIRNWYWFSELAVIVYNISGNRFCERIGRQHKSNNVMYIVDLQRARYYQKCHDPDCRDYKSPLRPIPCQILPVDQTSHCDEQDDDLWWQEVASLMDGLMASKEQSHSSSS